MPKKKIPHKERVRRAHEEKKGRRHQEPTSTESSTEVEGEHGGRPHPSQPAAIPGDTIQVKPDLIRQGCSTPAGSSAPMGQSNHSKVECISDLSLWKIGGLLRENQLTPLALKLGIPKPKTQNILHELHKSTCSLQEAAFKLLTVWEANQVGDQSAQLVTTLQGSGILEGDIQPLMTEEVFVVVSKEPQTPLTEIQLYYVAEELDASEFFPLGLRLGLSRNELFTIKHDYAANSVEARYQALFTWQSNLGSRVDQVETLARVLEACHKRKLAYQVRAHNLICVNEGKTLRFAPEDDFYPVEDGIDVQLNVSHPVQAVCEEAQHTLQGPLRGVPAEPTPTQAQPSRTQRSIRDSVNWCKTNLDMIRKVKNTLTREELYYLFGFTIESIHLHMKVHSTKGMQQLQRDIESGVIGRQLGEILLSTQTRQKLPDSFSLNVQLQVCTKPAKTVSEGETSKPLEHVAATDTAEKPAGSELRATQEVGAKQTPLLTPPVVPVVPQELSQTAMEAWSEEEVQRWLEDIVRLSSDIAHKFEGVDGFTLVRYEKDELREDFDLPPGLCRRLLRRRDDHLEKERSGTILRSDSSRVSDEDRAMSAENVGHGTKSQDDTIEVFPRVSLHTQSDQTQVEASTSALASGAKSGKEADTVSSLAQNVPSRSASAQKDDQKKYGAIFKQDKHRSAEDVQKKLTKLLLGTEKGQLDSSYYPVLVVNSPSKNVSSVEDVEKKFRFMSSVNWNAVFDCNPNSNQSGLCQYVRSTRSIKILSAEDFTGIKDVDLLREQINFPEVPVWVFPNGRYDSAECREEKLPDVEWMRERSRAVLETVRFFSDPGVIPKGRAVLLFLLLSDSDGMVMSQIFREFYTSSSFRNLAQFTVIAEDQGLLQKWLQLLHELNIVAFEDMSERCVGGVLWQDIDMYIQRLIGSFQTNLPLLPISPRETCPLMKKHQSQWSDITIVAKNECENTAMDENNPNFLDFVQEKELQFYHGHEVDWWNFYLSEEKFNAGKGFNHVLTRQSYKKLHGKVQQVLSSRGKKVEHISMMTVFHEAGSGGTTVAKNILWGFHREYRSVVVNRVTNDTVNQIMAFRRYGFEGDQKPGPVLMLLENVDSESMHAFLVGLERETRYIRDEGLAFAIIHCKRTLEPERVQQNELTKGAHSVVVQHKLTQDEIQWFQQKTTDLEEKKVVSKKYSPEHLLAFMIMKTECDPDYLSNVVKGILSQLHDGSDQCKKSVDLLKYIAVVQKFNPDFAMPVSACDGFMQKKHYMMSTGRHLQAYELWEKNKPEFMNLLLIEEYIRDIDGCVKGVALVHHTVACEIVRQLGEYFKQTEFDMVLELLEKSTILDAVSHSIGYVQKVCRDLMIRRQKIEYGDNRDTEFAPFIEDAYEKDKAMAFKIMEVGIQKFKDPFIAQHKARLHSKRDGDSEKAEQAINIGLGLRNNNSYLWDTKGIILREKMLKFDKKELIEDEEMGELLQTFKSACAAFQNAQRVMEEEPDRHNYAGFVGEIFTILKFLDIMHKRVRAFRYGHGLEKLQKYLVTPDYFPPEMQLSSLLDCSDEMKLLSERVDTALGRFTDYIAQCAQQRFGAAQYRVYDSKLEKIYDGRNTYFALSSRPTRPEKYQVETAYAMRRSEVKRMRGDGYRQIFEMASKKKVSDLKEVQSLLRENLPNPNLFDLKNLVFVSFALSVCTESGLEPEVQKYVELLKTKEKGEGFYGLFFEMLLNWPDEAGGEKPQNQPIASTIKQLREQWKNKYSRQFESDNNRQGRTKIRQVHTMKPTTEFYLGKPDGKSKFVHRMALGRISYATWKEEMLTKHLQRLEGVLVNKNYVLYRPKGEEPMKINLSMPLVGMPSQECVLFFLGFSFAGPLAYDVTYKDDRETHFLARETVSKLPSYIGDVNQSAESLLSID